MAGKLDNAAYLNFCLEILGRTEMAVLDQWHSDYMRDCIEPIVLHNNDRSRLPRVILPTRDGPDVTALHASPQSETASMKA